MPTRVSRRAALFGLLAPVVWIIVPVCATGGLLRAQAAPAVATVPLPSSLSDTELWRLKTEMSEPGGVFTSENFTSNELAVGIVAGMLRANGPKGGAYLGVGPEQNFSYISATRPDIAFLIDIRPQGILEHLMYKAIFEMSATRIDFLQLLFCKPRPTGVDSTSSITQIWNAFWPLATDTTIYRRNLQAIEDRLTKTHGFPLTADELTSLEHVYYEFYWLGPSVNYAGTLGGAAATFASLSWQTDNVGVEQTFLASEANYRVVKSLHEKNLIVPVVGDFGGDHAIRAIGDYIRAHGTTLNTFYLSNVEQYLFQPRAGTPNGGAIAFYQNVATVPVAPTSVFLRPSGNPPPAPLCPIADYLAAFAAGRIYDYQQNAVYCTR